MNIVKLQGIGSQKAKPAKDFSVGEGMNWNEGYKSDVVGILKETKCFITFSIQCRSDGKVYQRRLKKDRLVAIG